MCGVCVCVHVCVRTLNCPVVSNSCDPMDYTHQAPLSIEFSRQENNLCVFKIYLAVLSLICGVWDL